MIIEKEVEIKITKKNIDRYSNLGYNAMLSSNLTINIEHLEIGYRKRIHCKCSNCGSINDRKFADYNKCISKQGFYVCRNNLYVFNLFII